MTTRDVAKVGELSMRDARATSPRERAYVTPTPSPRQKLRTVALPDGRVRLIDSRGNTFLLCATAKTAVSMRAVFST